MESYNEEEKYENIKKEGIVVVKFCAVWCKPCKSFSVSFNRLKSQFQNIKFISLDIDEQYKWSDVENVKVVPIVKIFNDGELVKITDSISTIKNFLMR